VRFAKVERAGSLKRALIFGVVRVASGHRAPDVVRTLLYRESFFGKPHSKLTQRVMRGASDWSVGERELFAAFVSRLNQCPF
jgi:hypothetical protein